MRSYIIVFYYVLGCMLGVYMGKIWPLLISRVLRKVVLGEIILVILIW